MALDAATEESEAPVHEVGDLDGDGATEIRVRWTDLVVLLQPAEGGTVTELAYRPLRFDLADVLTRRREHSHLRIGEAEADTASGGTIHKRWRMKEAGLERLALSYDSDRRASLQDYLFAPGRADGDDVESPWPEFPGRPYAAEVREDADRLRVDLRTAAGAAGAPIDLAKAVEVRARGAHLEVGYELRSTRPLAARFAVRWNLAVTGPAPDRYCRLPTGARASLDQAGTWACSAVELVDEWLGLIAALDWTPGGQLAGEPVYTVSLSEEGLERVWQGVQLTISWPVELDARPWGARINLDIREGNGPRSAPET